MRVRVVAVECMLGNEDRNLSKSGTANNALQNTIIENWLFQCMYSKLYVFIAHFDSEYSASLHKEAFQGCRLCLFVFGRGRLRGRKCNPKAGRGDKDARDLYK